MESRWGKKRFKIHVIDCIQSGCLKSEEFKHRVTEGWSFTEKVKLKINTLCNSVSLYLRVENTFETASFFSDIPAGDLFRKFHFL